MNLTTILDGQEYDCLRQSVNLFMEVQVWAV